MPGRNADSLLNLISLMVGFNINFKVLWDNDSEGIAKMAVARKAFGEEFADKHFFTLADEMLGAKEILQNMYEGTDLI